MSGKTLRYEWMILLLSVALGYAHPAHAQYSTVRGATVQVKSGSLSAAEAALPSGGTLVVSGVLTVSSTHVTPASINLKIENGGGFNVLSGRSLTINGPFEAGLFQVFFGGGRVTFTRGVIADIYVGWWYSGSGSWDSTLASALAACRNSVAWCDLPPAVSTSGTLTLGDNSLLRSLSRTGGMNHSNGYGTVWTHAPINPGVNIVATPGGTATNNVQIKGISFVSGTYPVSGAALYLNYIVGGEIVDIQAAGPFGAAGILVSAVQDMKIDHANVINTASGTTMSTGIRFLGAESTPKGSLSTTTDLNKIVISGAAGSVTTGLVFDGDACLGCNVYSMTIETVTQNAVNVGKGNTVDFYSPYTENVPSRDASYGIFRIGQDYSTAAYLTYVNIFGGEVQGTNTQASHRNFGFDLGQYFGTLNVIGVQFGRMNHFQTNTADCTTCIFSIEKSNWTFNYAGGGFGATLLPQNFNFMADNKFWGYTPSLAVPGADRQQGTLANAPTRYLSPGQIYYATDKAHPYFYDSARQTWLLESTTLPAPNTPSGGLAPKGTARQSSAGPARNAK